MSKIYTLEGSDKEREGECLKVFTNGKERVSTKY